MHLDPKQNSTVRLSLTNTIPTIEVPKDTEWVKRIKIQSRILTSFWGHPMYLGAVVLLPKGYDQHPGVRYPVLYDQSHFSLDPPFDFTTEPGPSTDPRQSFLPPCIGKQED